jgi:hypothetical protein
MGMLWYNQAVSENKIVNKFYKVNFVGSADVNDLIAQMDEVACEAASAAPPLRSGSARGFKSAAVRKCILIAAPVVIKGLKKQGINFITS